VAYQEPATGSDATSWSVFKHDLGSSIEAIGLAPMLLVTAIVLELLGTFLGHIVFLGLPLIVIEFGFFGTLRVWFARVYSGERLSRGEVISLTRSFVGRFFVLGLLVSIVLAPFLLLAREPHHSTDATLLIPVALVLIAFDLGLTFVVPALALTTRSVREAFRIGITMIKQEWPASAWYLLTPGLTLGVVSAALQLSSFDPGLPLRLAVVAATTVLAVWFKGAIVAFYLRANR
jgi:hypothetical protein